MAKSNYENFPKNQKTWEKQAKQAKKYGDVVHTSIHDLEIRNSASKFTKEQFLDEWSDWNNYLADIEGGNKSVSSNMTKGLGVFSLVRHFQKRSQSSPFANPDAVVTELAMDTVQKKIIASPISKRTRGAGIQMRASEPPETPTPMDRIVNRVTPSLIRNQEDESDVASSLDDLSLKEEDESDVASSLDDLLDDLSLMEESIQDSQAPVTPETPAEAALHSPAQDEQIVNMALILLLTALTMFHARIAEADCEWSAKRLYLQFGQLKAITDGYLRRGMKTESILEVKPYVRTIRTAATLRQESAQMASWILQCPNEGVVPIPGIAGIERRLLISQNSFEIYITVAEYGPGYKEYLGGQETSGEGNARSFMTMTRYGPWKTHKYSHMKQLGPLILAFTLQQCSKNQDDILGLERGTIDLGPLAN